ncbi:MAG: hypothetical protein WKF68_11370 [Daejeonella sp.]
MSTKITYRMGLEGKLKGYEKIAICIISQEKSIIRKKSKQASHSD